MKNSKYFKFIKLTLVTTLCTFILIGCEEKEGNIQPNIIKENSNSESIDNTEIMNKEKKGSDIQFKKPNDEITRNAEEELIKIYSDTDKYEDHKVEFKAVISSDPGTNPNNKGTAFYCYPFGNEELLTYITSRKTLNLNKGDLVGVKGKLLGIINNNDTKTPFVFSYDTNKVENLSAPEVKTIEVNQEVDQDGYIVKVKKVEFKEEETIVYISVANNTDSKISFFSSSAMASQGINQLESKSTYREGEYDKVATDILPGVVEEGVVIFSKANADESLTIYLKGGRVDPFIFEVK